MTRAIRAPCPYGILHHHEIFGGRRSQGERRGLRAGDQNAALPIPSRASGEPVLLVDADDVEVLEVVEVLETGLRRL